MRQKNDKVINQRLFVNDLSFIFFFVYSYESPVLSESLPIWAEQQQLDNTLASYYLHSQAYLLVIASLLLAVSFSARAQPFTYKEGKHVYHTSLLCCPIYFLCVLIIYRQLAVAQPATHFDQPTALGLSRSPFAADLNSSKSIEIERSAASESAIRSSLHSQTNSNHRSMIRSESNDANASTSEAVRSASRNAMDHWRALLARKLRLLAVIQSVCLLCVATACLAGIFGPIALAIHRYGVLPKKPHSYADSLSTAFTLFKSGALPPAQEITGGQFALLTTSGKRTLATLNGITMINEQRSPNQPKSSAQSPSSGQSLTSTNSDSSMDNDYAAHNQDQHIVSELQARIQAATASSEIAYAQKIMNGSSMLRTLRNSLKSFSNNQTERLKSSERPTIPPAPPLPFSQTLLDRLSCASTGRSSSSDHYQSHVSVEQVNIGSGAQFNYATTPNYHRFKYVLNNLTEDLNQALHSSVTAVNTAGQLNEYVRNDLVRNPLYQDQQVNTAFRSAYP